ncbi:MAG: TetR/AcrR family transcriptional regulator [Myxococcota bacterium]
MTDRPEKRRPGRPKTVDRQRTIELATDTYWREGVQTLSLNEVCRRARISKPALYREFGGEDGLMDAALGHYYDLVVAPVLKALSVEQPFGQVAEQLIVAMTTDSDAPAGCLFSEMRLVRARLGPTTKARLLAIELLRQDAFEAWFRRAVGRGEVDGSVPPELAGRYLDTQFAFVLLQLGAGEDAAGVRAQARIALRAFEP